MTDRVYGGMEKERVRQECWYPLLREERLRADRAGERFRYLTLPGRQLTELRELVEKEGIIESPSELILVERDLMDYYAVLRAAPLLKFKHPVEPITVIHGDIDKLLSDGTFDQFLPVSAINLDYCGFYWGGGNLESRKWKSVQRLINIQTQVKPGETGRPFTLLLTVQGRGGAQSSISDALDEYKGDIPRWGDIATLPYHGRLLYALPLLITHLGFKFRYDVQCKHRYVYRPESVLGKATMLAFGFTFAPFVEVNPVASYAKQLADLEDQRCADILSCQPTRLQYDHLTQEVTAVVVVASDTYGD